MKVKRYNETALIKFGDRVSPNEANGELCAEILRHAAHGDGFVEFITNEICGDNSGDCTSGDIDPEAWLVHGQGIYPTAAAFIGYDYGVMSQTAKLLGNLEKRDAASPGVWALINARMIELGIVQPAWFAASPNGVARPGSKDITAMIEETLSLHDDGQAKINDMARLIVRRFAGGYRARGKRDMYLVCPPARAWWICRLAEEAIQGLEGAVDEIDEPATKIADILVTSHIWEKLCEKFVSQLTVTGDINIRNGILLYLLKREQRNIDNAIGPVIKRAALEDILRRIGQMSTWRALGSLSAIEVMQIIDSDIAPYAERMEYTLNGMQAN